MAHKNLEQLNKLINHLKTDFSLYIHIDRNSQIHIKNTFNVHTIKKFRSYWGSYNFVLATRELMKIASKNNHLRYLLISGQDLPIISNQDIIEFFKGNKNNYIHGEKLPAYSLWAELPEGGFERLRYYYFHDYNSKKLMKYISAAHLLLHSFQDLLSIYRKIPDNLYGGSNWWNLTHEAVMICLGKMYDKAFMKPFKFSRLPDELVVQSIVYNSPKVFSTIISDDLRYIDWSLGPTPKILINEDYDKIMTSGKLFARKFDDSIDAQIIERIYKSKLC